MHLLWVLVHTTLNTFKHGRLHNFLQGALWGLDAEGVEAAPKVWNRGTIGTEIIGSRQIKKLNFCCVK